MNELKLADDLYVDLLDGRKKCTVRAGIRQVKLGPLTFSSTSGTLPPISVDVREVRILKAGSIPDDVAHADGARTGHDLFNSLKRFYPDLDPSDNVTAVFFELN